jgi:hypothetical protein
MLSREDYVALFHETIRHHDVDIYRWIVRYAVLEEDVDRGYADLSLLRRLAVRHGCVFVLEWLYQRGLLPPSVKIGEITVRYRQRECLEFLLAHDRTYPRTTLDAAFQQGRRTNDYTFYIWLMQFLLRTNRWDEDLHRVHVLYVAKQSFGLLRRLHSHGLPLCSNLIPYAIQAGDDNELLWLLKNGCPWSVDTTETLKKRRRQFLESVCVGQMT